MNHDLSRTAESLIAILVAARRAGDRQLERLARRELLQRHGLRIGFASDYVRSEAGGDDVQ